MQRTFKAIFAVIVLILVFYFHKNRLHEFPAHTHAWAQSDRYALALNFKETGFDLFHPRTYCLNPLHRIHGQPLETADGITAVDFPVHEYIAALLMKIFHTDSIFIFRFYVLLLSLAGLFFLYKTAMLITQSFPASAFVVLFALSSTLFLFYMASPLATICSLAFCLAAFYYYLRYKSQSRDVFFYCSLLLLTIAALSRTSFSIYWLTLFLAESWSQFQNRKFETKKFAGFILSALCIAAYYAYNLHLRKIYGSMFLADIAPPESWSEMKMLMQLTVTRWKFDFLTPWHYGIILLLAIALVFQLKSIQTISALQKTLSALLFIAIPGSICFAILMMKQLIVHDYYLLDIFFMAVILLLLTFLGRIENLLKNQIAVIGCTLLFSLLAFWSAAKKQTERLTILPGDRQEITTRNFTNSKALLSRLKIPASAKIMVWDAYTPNIPLILMDRKGFSILRTTRAELEQSLKYSFDYIIVQKDFFYSDILTVYEQAAQHLIKMGEDDHLIVYKYANAIVHKNLLSFLQINDEQPVFTSGIREQKQNWENIFPATDTSYYVLDTSMEYGPTLTITDPSWLNKGDCIVQFEASVRAESVHFNLVVSVEDEFGIHDYTSREFNQVYLTDRNWKKVFFHIPVRKILLKNQHMKIYLWNENKAGNFFYKDIQVKVYAQKNSA